MKIIHSLLAAMTLLSAFVASGCRHPYNEDIAGSFPYMDGCETYYISIPSSSYMGKFDVMTNMHMTYDIQFYDSEYGWLEIKGISYDADKATVKYEAQSNRSQEERYADIILTCMNSSQYVRVTQDAYVMQPDDFIYKGDLVLKTQKDVNSCIYRTVTGSLTIGDPDSDSGSYITDISSLQITEIGENLHIVNCPYLKDISSLSQVQVKTAAFSGMKSEAISTFSGRAENMELEFISFEGNLTDIKDMKGLKALSIHNPTDLLSLDGAEGLSTLNALSVSGAENLDDISALANCSSLNDITFENCHSLSRLKTIADNFTDIDNFRYSGGRASETQANYIRCLAEDHGTKDNFTFMNLTGNQILETPRLVNDASVAADFASVASGFDYDTEFHFIVRKTGDSFSESFADRLTATSVSDEKTVSAADLEPDTEYLIYACAIDRDGEVYMSDPYYHRTGNITYYNLGVSATFPEYETLEDYGDIATLKCFAYNPEYNSPGRYGKREATNDGSNGFLFENTISAGTNRLFFNTLNSFESNSDYTVTTDSDGSVNGIEVKGTNGTGCDVRMARTTLSVEGEQSTDITLHRAVARLNIDTKFKQNVSTLDIEEITVTVKNVASKAYIADDNTSPKYEGSANLIFAAAASSSSTTQTIATNVHTLPNVNGARSEVEISLKMKDGSTVNSSTTIPQTLKNNSFYSITFDVSFRSTDNTFTIDQVEIVEDIIEF